VNSLKFFLLFFLLFWSRLLPRKTLLTPPHTHNTRDFPSFFSLSQACDRLTSSLRGMSQRDLSGKTTDDVADAYASDFSEWCLNDATSRQLRLSTMTSMAEGVSNLGRRFLRSLDRYQSEKSDKVVLTRTLQDEIHGLRQRNEGFVQKILILNFFASLCF